MGNREQSPGDDLKGLVECDLCFIRVLNKISCKFGRGRLKKKEHLLKEVSFCLWVSFSGCQVGKNSINQHVSLSDVPSMHSRSGVELSI